MAAVIATTTMYKALQDVRAKLAIETVKQASELGYEIIVVDNSPPEIKDIFRKYGAKVADSATGMGVGRRIAIQLANDLTGTNGVIIWMEPEKAPLVPYLAKLIEPITAGIADLVIPKRRSLSSYPLIQQHFEWLGNEAFRLLTGRVLDAWSGPRIFRPEIAPYFLNYKGEYGDQWDSIFIPVLRAIKDGKKVIGVEVNYIHPAEQTAVEDDFEMYQKRRYQLNTLIEAMEKEAKILGLYPTTKI
ncbi:MAG: hypothetical protein PHF44_00555 [Candidatus Pacebacteria bacterium]|nr:hypothetical protein [Candidatus Paceibacterota bacterium]